jgi:hypothetical protein
VETTTLSLDGSGGDRHDTNLSSRMGGRLAVQAAKKVDVAFLQLEVVPVT